MVNQKSIDSGGFTNEHGYAAPSVKLIKICECCLFLVSSFSVIQF